MNPLLGTEKDFKDKDVCKYMLAGFCPHELFPNTKVDLGACQYKIHDPKQVKQYQQSPEFARLGYESDLSSLLHRLVTDMDRAIRRTRERIDQTAPNEIIGDEEGEREEKVVQLEEQIRGAMAQIEEFGENGEVEKAQELLATVESYKQAIEAVKNSGPKRMIVCDVCSACLVANDQTARMDSHLTGKQHMGYLKIRQWLEEYKQNNRSAPDVRRNSHHSTSPPPPPQRRRDSRDDHRDRWSSRGGGGGGGGGDRWDRDRERDRGDRDRHRERERYRDRDREKDNRERSPDRRPK